MQLTWQSLVLHLINIVVLYVLLRVLLYKPIVKFIRKRKDEYARREQSVAEREESVSEREAEASAVLDASQAKGEQLAAEEVAAAQAKARAILEEANEKADRLIQRAQAEIEQERRVMRESLQEETVSLAVKISEKVIAKNLSDEDNRAFIRKCLSEEQK